MFARYRMLAAALAAALVLAACSAGLVSDGGRTQAAEGATPAESIASDAELMAEFGLTAEELAQFRKDFEECQGAGGIPGTDCPDVEFFLQGSCAGAPFCLRLTVDAAGDVGVFTVTDQAGQGLLPDETDQDDEPTCSSDPALCRSFTVPRAAIDSMLTRNGSSSGSATAETTDAPSSSPDPSASETETESSPTQPETSPSARSGAGDVLEPPVAPSANVDAGAG